MLEKLIAAKGMTRTPPGTPADWAVESWKLAKAALVANGADIDEKYYKARIPVIDERMAQAGVRLAASLNRVFVAPPPQ